jgi:hypothetical protein
MEENVVTNARQAFEQAVNPPQPVSTTASSAERWQRIVMSVWGQALIGSLIVMVVLFVLNPPMVQSKKNSDIEKPQRDIRKILIWSGITAGLIVVVPVGVKYFQNSFKKK